MIEPDPAAQNYEFDLNAARRFFRTAQRLLVPLVIVSRFFAQAVQLPRSFFDLLAETKHGGEVGQILHDKQRACILMLWKAVGAAKNNSTARRNLPEGCSKEWFINSFCGGIPPASDRDDEVWSKVRSFNVYNLLAILMALPPMYNRFVSAKCVAVRSTNHSIV